MDYYDFPYSTAGLLGFEVVLIVVNVLAASCPHVRVVLSILLDRVHEGLHALAVGAFLFLQVHNVEGVVESYKVSSGKLPFLMFLTAKKYH